VPQLHRCGEALPARFGRRLQALRAENARALQ
jgi:hypothetical protein